ncbi:MAG: 50S ribosomal protein L30 [Spirochaetaceae bacterium]|nr:50S ribosomal protein L30 [Spirochaetaceae bacterium]
MAQSSTATDAIRVRLTRSPLGSKPRHRRTVAALGLHRVGSSVEHAATPDILGMINQVSYLLTVEPVGENS